MSERQYPLASYKRRSLAWILDATVVSVPVGFIISGFGLESKQIVHVVKHKLVSSPAPIHFGTRILEGLIWVVMFTLYYAIMEASSKGQTLGKRWTGIATVRIDNGLSLSYPRAAIRGLISSGLIAAGLLLGIVSYLWPIWDHKRRTFHDMAVGSAVISVY